MRFSGWYRVGIVVSAIWVLGASVFLRVAVHGLWLRIAVMVFLSTILGWGLVYLIVAIARRQGVRRGLFRIWLLLSAAWSVGFLGDLLITSPYWPHVPWIVVWPRLLVGAPIPWLLTGTIFGLRWAIRGFSRN